MDASQILDTVIGSVIGTVCSAIYSFFKKIWEKRQKKSKKEENLERYYEYVKKTLDEEEKTALVGDGALSDEAVYIDAYSVKPPKTKILNIIEQWSKEEKSRVMLIHGEPGHGKTTLCCKAVYEHHSKRFCKDKKKVFWFRLNPAFAEDIIKDGKFVLKNAFCWGNPEIESISKILPEENEKEYNNSIVFLDGYDELKVQLHEINRNLIDFIDSAEQLARTYHMHIIITTRTRSLDDEFVSSSIKKLQFAPMSEEQQNKWIEKNAPGYQKNFEVLRSSSSEEMKEMLGIPILFRMVVKAELRSTNAKNVVDLYDTLFEATMLRRKMKGGKIEKRHKKYEQLAYEIYCNDETFANMRGKKIPKDFLYLFYLKGNGEKHVEFLHRSFYQYFLAHFLYRKMSAVQDKESAEAFLCCLAERRIDRDVLNYIRQIQEKKSDVTQEKCEQIINTLEQTGTIIVQALQASNENGNAEKHRLRRCNNIFVNALSICCVVAATKGNEFIISLRKKENLHAAMRRYDCSNIWLENVILSGAELIGAELIGANLIGADLSRANLRGTGLSNANLSGADLREATKLDRCHCEQVADWTGCKILLRDKHKLGLKDPDAHGIIWCDNETGNPIEP